MGVKPGYKQTEVGVIPEEWEVKVVGDAFEIRNQLRLPISQSVRERMAGPFPYYGPTSVQGWINEYRVEGEHALIGEDGDHFLKWRDQAMTLLVSGKFNVNNHAHIVRGTKNLTAWFYWFFANRDISNYLTRQGAGRYKLTKATLLKLPCAIPTQPEQSAIATALSDVDALLGGLDRLIAKKRDLKQAAMQQFLSGQTRLPGFHGEWEVKRLGELFEITSSKRVFQREWKSEGIPFYRARELAVLGETGRVNNELFITKSLYEAFKAAHGVPEAGDMLVTGVGTLGKVYIVTDSHDFYFKDGNIIWFKIRGSVAPEFLRQLFLTKVVMKQITDASAGTTVGTYTISGAKKTEIPFPALPEQTAIAAVLSDMDAELAALEARRDKTGNLKQAMMQELLTGRVRLVN
jgi:type I restriction enzyme S subunit